MGPAQYGAETASHEAYQGSAYAMEEPLEEHHHPQDLGVSPQRAWATIVMIIGTVVFLLSLVVLAGQMTEGPLNELFAFWSFTTWVWVFFGILAALLIAILVLLATTPARQEEEWYGGDEEEESETAWAQPAQPGAPDTISLRCPKCMNIFSLQDPGERPFHHECPHCEVRGMYSGP